MKGRHGAAHFAAFPRPPNYRNRNTNAHTNNKEKKLKKILASVFLVLAVIAAVGVFGLQTTDRAEAQTAGAARLNAAVNSGGGVPDITIVSGTTYVIDLSEFVTDSDDATASTTYHLITTRNRVFNPDATGPEFTGEANARNTANGWISSNPGNPTRLTAGFRSQCAPGATTCADSAGPAVFISLDEDTGLLTLRGNADRGDGSFGTRAALVVHWAADSTPGNNVGADAVVTPASLDTLVAINANAGTPAADFFTIAVEAAPSSGATPARGTDSPVPTTFFPSDAALTGATPSTALTATAPGANVVWTLGTLPTDPTAYAVVAHSSDTDVAQIGSVVGNVVTISPRSPGTAKITIDVIPSTLVTGSSLRARTATTGKWRVERDFTVSYATEAPSIEIYRDVDGDGKDPEDPRGNSADNPIDIQINSGSSGQIAELLTDSTATATYQNRIMNWRLADANGANVTRNFKIDNGELRLRADIDLGDDNALGGTGDDADTNAGQTFPGLLSIKPGVTLEAGSTHLIQVIAEDLVTSGFGEGVEGGETDRAFVRLTVLQGNRPPVLQNIPTQSILETDSPDPAAPDVGDELVDLEDFASDPDNTGLTYAIRAVADTDNDATNDQSLGDPVKFRLNGSSIELAAAVDYEDADEDGTEDTAAEMAADGYDADAVRWTFTVFVTDDPRADSSTDPESATDGISWVSGTISFRVIDEEDETPIAATGLEFSINEGNAVGAVLGNVLIPESTDADADDADEGYSLVGDAAGGNFRLSDAGVLTAIAVLDHEEEDQYRLTATVDNDIRLVRSITITVNDVNEKPVFNNGATPTPVALTDAQRTAGYVARVSEAADSGNAVAYGVRTDTQMTDATYAVARGATDPDDGDVLSYSLVAANAAGTAISDPEVAFSGPFSINATTGVLTVSGTLDTEATPTYTLYVKATDDDATTRLSDTVKLTITVTDANELPFFVTTSGGSTMLAEVDTIEVNENTASPTVLTTYHGYDPDGNDFEFVLRTSLDSDFFSLVPITGNANSINLTPKAGRTLDYETKATYQVEIEIVDSQGAQSQILQTINLRNLNDNSPVWQTPHTTFAREAISVNENVLRGTDLATYTATDADGDTITYTLGGTNGGQYQIGSANGMLKTLGSLDADTNTSDAITVTASDGTNSITRNVRITIGDVNDRIGSITVKMANPVLGTNGDPNSALADRKETESLAVPEAPGDLPATSGDAVVNFVETGAAGWGTTLRIEVLAESPDSACGNGNQCVVIELEGDDSDDILKVMAYRNSGKDNQFVAAVMPVQNANMATPGDAAVYKHTDGSVPRVRVDEEDTLRIKFGNLRDSVTIDNEAPEFSNFLPEHEASIDDEEVEYTFNVTDAIAKIPEPEDLPDVDGDDNYMAVAALVNTQQCHNVAQGVTPPSGTRMVANTNLHEDAQIYCPSGTTPEVRVIVDDKDLTPITDGFEVETEVVLNSNQISYVTFIACDAAGNCVAFDPDENDTKEALAKITVDTIAPDLSQARTGVMWDAADNKYDDSRSFIQAIFTDLSKLNPDTIEADDFVVDGYTIKRVYWYDDPDAEDENWGTRYDTGSGSRAYREISKTVFIELEEELLPDATPDVSVVPNGLEDEAGKEQDDDEVEADDWIAPKFAVQSITSPRETSRDNVLVGEDEKVTLTVTSDERISTTKPLVDVDYVNAPAGCVDRSGIILRAGRDTDGDGRLEPGEARADCAVNAKGTPLNSVISKDGTNEWTITVDKPSATGYYNVYIYADDRSSQNNRGSEGVNPDEIVTKFFEKDGDVNADDAVYFEGDVQLPKPQVVVSGEDAGDTEPTVEFKRPLFIEVDFTEPFSADCSDADKLSNELECTAESAEYAQDGFDAVTITRFELDGVDMTDDVKTTDDETFLIALDDVGIGDHELKIQATDLAGNELKDVLEIEFEVEERDPFTRRLNPGWNLVSLPGSPADSAIASVFGSDIEVRTVYTYNPVTPGGWQVAVRETLDDAWQGDLTDITAKSGYWVLSDAIQDLEVSIPRLAGGAVGASTPVQPPVIPMYAGWNLIPVVDVTGDALDTKKSINATTYLNSLDDGLDLARVLGFNTITNEWFTVIDPSDASVTDNLQIGSAYWVFVRESASLVPGGIPR